MKITTELRQIVALSLVKNMGPVAFKKLIEVFGDVSGIFKASAGEFRKIRECSKVSHAQLTDSSLLKRADEEIEKARAGKADIVTFYDKNYPQELREIYDPPILLYVKGKLPVDGQPKVAVVGSRLSSFYGQRMTKLISKGLAEAGVAVVSGLALGIDTAAHEGALEGNGVTVAVLGGGLNRLYPSENERLADEIVKRGAVISEYPMDMAPQPGYFPVRNRIISGLSRAVLVVEARAKSGALITADAALEQGRDVFAVPGNADSARSQGTNTLLKQGAKFVTSAEDILEELKIETAPSKKQAPAATSGDENRLLSLLDGEPLHVDTLIEASGIPAKGAISTLSMMEIKGWVKQLPGKNFSKM